MSSPEIPPVEPLGELEFNSQSVEAGIKDQFTQPGDIKAAHSYFNGGGQEMTTSHLPDLGLDSGLPANMQGGSMDLSINQSILPGGGAESGLINGLQPTGLEGNALMPGLEQGALAGMPPGTEPISPMIQMILKMPGLTGTVASFFEAIMSFLFPADGGFLNLLDPTLWAQTAQQAFGSLVTAITDHIPLSLTMMPNSGGFFDFFSNTGMQSGMFDSLTKTAAAPADVSFSGLSSPAPDASNFLVNGQVSPGKPLFETALPDSSQVNISQGGEFLAMDQGNSFGPTVGGYSQANISVDPQSVTTSSTGTGTSQMQQELFQSQKPGGDGSSITPEANNRGDLLADQSAPENIEATPGSEGASYTIQKGDNLWDIAREHLGSGSRWQEIYNLNTEVIGGNPNLIFSGSELQLPAADTIAGSHDYLVKSGDNLWNIAREHMGSGSQWPSIYSDNSQVIGSDPGLIHPGQHLAVPDGQAAGSTHLAHHHSPATSHGHKLAHSKPAASHPSHGQNHSQPHTKSGSSSPKTDGQGGENLAQTPGSDTTADTILKQARSSQASAQNEIEKTAQLPPEVNQPQPPVGLRAVAKSL